ncbi:hypothetical protein ATANTOWER_000356 [Ataeniobius toweri]|uniref:Uncharacterized protein n=1 Tax=Ataeniobius toweri TaxID=208326 RepID=A0ABU7ACR5_9TELE|nr:hypothetical protein [Ataeniobius toweri]
MPLLTAKPPSPTFPFLHSASTQYRLCCCSSTQFCAQAVSADPSSQWHNTAKYHSKAQWPLLSENILFEASQWQEEGYSPNFNNLD